ncbi:MAG TPA: sulfotransferase [Steroidobacteraceae bacterium]|jgi:tetratricopeptide (TPR) repeat protein|nr:sulfotransferase [Steroidobacteraceae bacterium]
MQDDSAAQPRPGTGPAGVRDFIDRRQFAEAARSAEALLADSPEERELLYMLAVAQRYLGRIPAALATLVRLEELHPDYPRLHQERGYCHVAQRAATPAIAAFERAVALNPALPGSWRTLQRLYTMAGRRTEADNAAAHVAKLASLPTAIVTARSMFADGEIEAAESLVRRYLLENGDDVEGMRLLAQIGMKLDVLDDAELLLESVLEQAPDYRPARYDYAQVLLQRHKHRQAREQIRMLREAEPEERAYRITQATLATELGECDQALREYRRLLEETPDHAELHLSMAHTLKTLGRQQDAVEAYRRAAQTRPGYGDAYWSLANLKTYRFTDEELAAMRAAEAAPRTALADRFHLCFALGKALEDRAEYADSFSYYQRGNALKKSESRYRPEFIERNTRLQIEVCTSELFAARRGWGDSSNAPIFIVGLPRAGSTLIEQILASHSRAEGTMELSDIPRLAQSLQGRDSAGDRPRYPGVLAELPAEDFRRFGARYLTDTALYRSGKPRFIDKMPNNFRHLGLMHLVLPNAKIIDARRNAMACCFSNFKQLFASGQQFTYSLEDIARYYRTYVELMAHWDRVLPGKVLRVQHEDLVGDFEPQVRRILEFCELDFEPGCLEFHKTARRVHTASSEQVRRPINTEGLEQWRHFEPWLGPLAAALGELAEERP